MVTIWLWKKVSGNCVIDKGPSHIDKNCSRPGKQHATLCYIMLLPAEIRVNILQIRRQLRFWKRVISFNTTFGESRRKWVASQNQHQLDVPFRRRLTIFHQGNYFESVYKARCSTQGHDFPWCKMEVTYYSSLGKVHSTSWHSPCGKCWLLSARDLCCVDQHRRHDAIPRITWWLNSRSVPPIQTAMRGSSRSTLRVAVVSIDFSDEEPVNMSRPLLRNASRQ